ncbi:MAG: hypothetical protein SVX43_06905, partial [Cyanobacteriota bacterium]|nr:hypothetical protein [Cyanobacteriota bacterium]
GTTALPVSLLAVECGCPDADGQKMPLGASIGLLFCQGRSSDCHCWAELASTSAIALSTTEASPTRVMEK